MLTDSALRALADRFGTPLYVFDDRALVQRVRYLREALPTRVGICFAIKANPFVLPALEPLVDRLAPSACPTTRSWSRACIRTSRPYRAP